MEDRGRRKGFKHPKSWGKNSFFKASWVNSRFFLVYRNNSKSSLTGDGNLTKLRWVPKQTMWRTSWAILRLFYGCLRLFSIDPIICFDIGTKFALRSSKTKQEFYFWYFTGNSDEIETGIKLVLIQSSNYHKADKNIYLFDCLLRWEGKNIVQRKSQNEIGKHCRFFSSF